MRRVVTGHDADGKSVVVIDDHAKRKTELPNYPGYAAYEIWTTAKDSTLPVRGEDPTMSIDHFIPAPGETRFTIIQIPPDSEIASLAEGGEIDMGQAWAEFAKAFPDMYKTMETDNFMMHATDSIDYAIVLSGETWCVLDDGVEIHLTPGDCLVQCGTKHTWKYKGHVPCIIAYIMIGAKRD